MKKLIYLLLIGACVSGITACNSDDDVIEEPEVPTPEPVTTIAIDETNTIKVGLVTSLPKQGEITVKLTGDDDLAITGATEFNLLLMGYPNDSAHSVKYELAWHQTYEGKCIEQQDCELSVKELQSGTYLLTLDDVDWQSDVENFKVAIEVQGAKANLDYGFL
ncbi:hypothetical protein G3R49_10585 [Shewanella sp. WXL01]|uniref:Lipoprotein n=1 Tax=Shewanella maritima TaxID=2520507 RepID=A0A411PKD7_9GAMM|nr:MULTISPECIES: hypothetical protein [Shewanella]NKF51009.1 hypothetical protein [Shewanella sp. WXL01]QBF83970.1 hypothetical protein EXU30_15730 [Shewanella maritima]